MQRPQKLTILLIFWFISGIIGLIGAAIIAIAIGLLFGYELEGKHPNILIRDLIILTLVLLISFLELKVTYNLWKGHDSSRLLKILAILSLLSIPFGTALGIATFLILRSQEVKTFLTSKQNLPLPQQPLQ